MTEARPYPATPDQARRAGLKHYMPRTPCARGHLAMRTLDGQCVRCQHKSKAKINRVNPEDPETEG